MTEAQAIEARRLRSLGWKRIAIAAKLNVTEGAVNYATLKEKPPLLDIPAVTRLEAEALAYLGWHIGKYKRPPGKIAMAEHLDIGSHELGITIRALARKALIYRPPERPDSLELTRPVQ